MENIDCERLDPLTTVLAINCEARTPAITITRPLSGPTMLHKGNHLTSLRPSYVMREVRQRSLYKTSVPLIRSIVRLNCLGLMVDNSCRRVACLPVICEVSVKAARFLSSLRIVTCEMVTDVQQTLRRCWVPHL